MPIVMSEMRTGSTYVSEVLSSTLYNRPYVYMHERHWMTSPDTVIVSADKQLVKLHHGRIDDFLPYLNQRVKVVVPVRDPLDVYLSAAYHHAFTDNKSLKESVQHLERINWAKQICERMNSFLENRHENIAVIPYESLISAPAERLEKVLRHLQIPFNTELLAKNCVRFGFERKTGRKMGEEKVGTHERNGAVMQWVSCGIPEITEKRELSETYYSKVVK